MQIPHFRIERVSSDRRKQTLSYSLIEQPEIELHEVSPTDNKYVEEPLIKELIPPPRPQKNKPGLLDLLRKMIQGEQKSEQIEPVDKEPSAPIEEKSRQTDKRTQHGRMSQHKRGYSRKRTQHPSKKMNKPRSPE